jgi:hypothetical protein
MPESAAMAEGSRAVVVDAGGGLAVDDMTGKKKDFFPFLRKKKKLFLIPYNLLYFIF